nr:MAG TPA: hypothetical protein [Caudoviricetes sp.]
MNGIRGDAEFRPLFVFTNLLFSKQSPLLAGCYLQ